MVDKKGIVVATTDSGPDGLFYFEKIPLGVYKIIVQEKYSDSNKVEGLLKVELSKNQKNVMRANLEIKKRKKLSNLAKKIKNTKVSKKDRSIKNKKSPKKKSSQKKSPKKNSKKRK